MQQMQDVPKNTPNTPFFEDAPQMQDTPAASLRVTGWRKVCVSMCVCVCVCCVSLVGGRYSRLGFRFAGLGLWV
jgi:hypothetical protein